MGSTGARMVIKRITMFKVPKDEDIQAVLEAYDVMGKTAEKVRQSLLMRVLTDWCWLA